MNKKTLPPMNEQALAEFRDGFKNLSPKDEYWENSDLTFLKDDSFKDLENPVLLDLPIDTSLNELSAANLEGLLREKLNIEVKNYSPFYFINGFFLKNLSTLSGEGWQGSIFKNLSELFNLEKKSLTSLDFPNENIFLNQNLGFFKEGIFLKIEKATSVEKPFLFIFLKSTSLDGISESLLDIGKIHFSLEEGAQVKLLEYHFSYPLSEFSIPPKSLSNIFFYFNLQKKAELLHFTAQDENKNYFHIHYDQVILKENSNYTSYVFQTGAKLGVSQKKVVFSEEKAKANCWGLYLAEGEQNLDHIMDFEHEKGEGKSNQHYFGVIKDNSVVGFTGKVKVFPDSQKTDSTQLNKTIVLSKTATIKTRPQLEIYADDVKCGHGATVGPLDEENLFYLRSRGIKKGDCTKILFLAFARNFNNFLKKDFPELESWLEKKITESSFWRDF